MGRLCAHLDVVVQESCPVDDFFRVGLQDVCSKDFLLWGCLPKGLVFKGGHGVICVSVVCLLLLCCCDGCCCYCCPLSCRWVLLLLVGEWSLFKRKGEESCVVCNARSFCCQSWFAYGLRTSAQQKANYLARDFQMTSPLRFINGGRSTEDIHLSPRTDHTGGSTP